MVPVDSRRPGGVAVNTGPAVAQLLVPALRDPPGEQFATAVGRALHVLDAQLTGVRAQGRRRGGAPVGRDRHRLGPRRGALVGGDGDRDRPALEAAAGSCTPPAATGGWSGALAQRGVDAYGVDPRPRGCPTDEARRRWTCARRTSATTSGSVEPGALAGVVLSGVVEGVGSRRTAAPPPRRGAAAWRPAASSSCTRCRAASWEADDAPLEADLVPARPYRPATWGTVLGEVGFDRDRRRGRRRTRLPRARPAARCPRLRTGRAAVKVAFVTPRYGLDVMGGAEAAARQLAKHLRAECGWSVEVFTTCALDHITWDDVLPPGDSVDNGVTVHRFASASGRVPGVLRARRPHPGRRRPRPTWTRPPLARAQRAGHPRPGGRRGRQRRRGARLLPVPLLPDGHGHGGVATAPRCCIPPPTTSPRSTSGCTTPVFEGADAICYHTAAERRLVQRRHRVGQVPQIVLGLGVADVVEGGRPGGEVPRHRRQPLRR